MKFYRPINKYLIASFFNAVLFFPLVFLSQKIYFLMDSEASVFNKVSLLSTVVEKNSELTNIEDVIFINTSYDNLLVTNYDEKNTPLGNIPITNREHLIKFFGYLKKQQNHKYVLCDIFFEHKSAYDSVLEDVLEQPNLIIPSNKDSKDLVFDSDSINYGEAKIRLYNDSFFKYKLFEAKKKENSIPLKMYMDLHDVSIKRGLLWSKINGSFVLNDFIPKFYITNYELDDYKIKSNIHYLQDVATYPDVFLENMVKDKIIVVADLFEHDNYPTIVGNMPGSLILLNVYFSLVNMENKISVIFMIYLFIVLWIVSYFVFYPQEKLITILEKMPFLGRILIATTYLLIMAMISYITFFLFGLKISLVFVSLLLYFENVFLHRKYYLIKTSERIKHLFK